MALIFCTRCGHRVSTTAPKCPSCGTPPYSTRQFSPTPEWVAATQVTRAAKSEARVASQKRQSWYGPPGMRDLRILAAAVAGLALAGWWWFYLPTTPSWAVYSLYQDVKNHDGAAAQELIDFQSVTKGFIDTAVTEHESGKTTGEEEGQAEFEEIFARGIASLVVGPMSDALKSRFAQWVDNRDDTKYPISVGPVLEAILRLHRQGSTAFTQVTNDKGERLQMTLTRENGADWRITSVDSKSIREEMRESMETASKNTAGESSSEKTP